MSLYGTEPKCGMLARMSANRHEQTRPVSVRFFSNVPEAAVPGARRERLVWADTGLAAYGRQQVESCPRASRLTHSPAIRVFAVGGSEAGISDIAIDPKGNLALGRQRQLSYDAGPAVLAAPTLARSLRIRCRNRGGIVPT